MKNLFYKEMKLSMHPIIWVFMLLFPLMILIPSYPTFVAFIYICTMYPILFLGANKGQQSNDIYFSCLLPIKKSDVIKARMMTVLFMQLVTLAIALALSPLAVSIKDLAIANSSPEQAEQIIDIGFGPRGALVTAAFSIVSFAIYDFIFFACFYKNGRSILLSTFLGLFVFMIFETVFCIVLPLTVGGFKGFFEDSILTQAISLLIGILISALIHFLTFKVADREFEKVDL